jgi:hypothetical protein
LDKKNWEPMQKEGLEEEEEEQEEEETQKRQRMLIAP